jgi:hypothetical protein
MNLYPRPFSTLASVPILTTILGRGLLGFSLSSSDILRPGDEKLAGLRNISLAAQEETWRVVHCCYRRE